MIQMSNYYIWTVGCQMNVADSQRLGAALEQLGYDRVDMAENADIVVLNSCVIRQGAEDKVVARLDSLKGLKRSNGDVTIALTGCMVGPKIDALQDRFPHVDLFMQPQEITALVEFAADRQGLACDVDQMLLVPSRPQVSTFIPVIQGCDEFCTYCIVPYRRGRESSRPLSEIVRESEAMVARGVVEVTLLGQIVDKYGHDLPGHTDLADLLTAVNDVPGLERIRFLTSHPRDMSDRILRAVADLPKVVEHLNVPFQSGDDALLERMRRPYVIAEYLDLIDRTRSTIPGVALATDVIVGFCGETDREFQATIDVLEQVRFDTVHIAAYSTRPGTIADRKIADDVPPPVKLERKNAVEELQKSIATEINSTLQSSRVEVLVERNVRDRWEGRTRTNKLVHFDDDGGPNRIGTLVEVEVVRTSPWSLTGNLPGQTFVEKVRGSEISLVPVANG
jgi:tRNA-2-methylthio-N6-dimethylallyladenosine synthase